MKRGVAILIGLVVLILGGGAMSRYSVESIQDVRSYGAKGNGKDDDTAALQRAIDSLPANGGTVIFPAGLYKTSATLNVPEYVILRGAGMRASTINFGGAGYAIALGSSSAKSMVYGTGLADIGVLLSNPYSNGITLQTTAGAVLTNIYLQGDIPNTSTAIFVDGGNVANQFTGLTNVIANHFKVGYRLGSSGTSTTTSLVATNITSFGDTIHGVKGSIGIQIDEHHGQGSRFYGGNMESCTNGIYGKGDFVMINGMRFEGNAVDIVLESPASAWLITGCMGLDNLKNSSTRNFVTSSFKSNLEPFPNTFGGAFSSSGPV